MLGFLFGTQVLLYDVRLYRHAGHTRYGLPVRAVKAVCRGTQVNACAAPHLGVSHSCAVTRTKESAKRECILLLVLFHTRKALRPRYSIYFYLRGVPKLLGRVLNRYTVKLYRLLPPGVPLIDDTVAIRVGWQPVCLVGTSGDRCWFWLQLKNSARSKRFQPSHSCFFTVHLTLTLKLLRHHAKPSAEATA